MAPDYSLSLHKVFILLRAHIKKIQKIRKNKIMHKKYILT